MSKISEIIGPQNFELVRDKIAEILAIELAEQFVLSGDADINATVWLERFVPFNYNDSPAVNVSIGTIQNPSKDSASSVSELTINVDAIFSAKTDNSDNGDSLAQVKSHKLIGKCRAILETPAYDVLDFARSSDGIGHTSVQSIDFASKESGDAVSVAMSRMKFLVKVSETVPLVGTVPLVESNTRVTLELTDKGYRYIETT